MPNPKPARTSAFAGMYPYHVDYRHTEAMVMEERIPGVVHSRRLYRESQFRYHLPYATECCPGCGFYNQRRRLDGLNKHMFGDKSRQGCAAFMAKFCYFLNIEISERDCQSFYYAVPNENYGKPLPSDADHQAIQDKVEEWFAAFDDVAADSDKFKYWRQTEHNNTRVLSANHLEFWCQPTTPVHIIQSIFDGKPRILNQIWSERLKRGLPALGICLLASDDDDEDDENKTKAEDDDDEDDEDQAEDEDDDDEDDEENGTQQVREGTINHSAQGKRKTRLPIREVRQSRRNRKKRNLSFPPK